MLRALLVAIAVMIAAPAAALADGEIAGTVTDAAGSPVEAAFVAAIPDGEFDAVAETQTHADGTYALAGLPAGDYVVEFDGPDGSDLVTEYFDNHSQAFFSADLVTVSDGQTTPGIDAALELGGAIAGKVTDAAGDPVAGAVVDAIPPGADDILETTTDTDGTYLLNGLAGGVYAVQFSGPPGSLCPGGSHASRGKPACSR